MERRYSVLRLIGAVHMALGVIIAALTVLFVIGILAASLLGGAAIDAIGRQFGNDIGPLIIFRGILGGLVAAAVVVITGGVLAALLYGMGEGIFLLLSLEENTRATSLLLQRQLNLRAPQPRPEAAEPEPEVQKETPPVLASENSGSV